MCPKLNKLRKATCAKSTTIFSKRNQRPKADTKGRSQSGLSSLEPHEHVTNCCAICSATIRKAQALCVAATKPKGICAIGILQTGKIPGRTTQVSPGYAGWSSPFGLRSIHRIDLLTASPRQATPDIAPGQNVRNEISRGGAAR